MAIIRNLVLAGGGVAGVYAYPGAMNELRKKIDLKNIERIAGVSIGAITALTLALQFTEEETEKFIANIDFKKLDDSAYLPTTKFRDVTTRYGYYKGDALFRIIKDIFLVKKCDPDKMTFMDLKALTGIDLFITATYVYKENGHPKSSPFTFSTHATPDTPIAPTILASAAVCPYFPRVRLKKMSETQYILSNNTTDPAFVDGGFQNNFPINMFDSPKFFDADHPQAINRETLGIVLQTDAEIKQHAIHLGNDNNEMKIEQINDGEGLEFIYALLHDSAIFRQTEVLKKREHYDRTIKVNKCKVNITEFVITKLKQDELYKSGIDAVEKFFVTEAKKLESKLSTSSITPLFFKPNNSPPLIAYNKEENTETIDADLYQDNGLELDTLDQSALKSP